jgi:hypothetical protein
MRTKCLFFIHFKSVLFLHQTICHRTISILTCHHWLTFPLLFLIQANAGQDANADGDDQHSDLDLDLLVESESNSDGDGDGNGENADGGRGNTANASNDSNDNDSLLSDDDSGGESMHPEDEESDAVEAGNLRYETNDVMQPHIRDKPCGNIHYYFTLQTVPSKVGSD